MEEGDEDLWELLISLSIHKPSMSIRTVFDQSEPVFEKTVTLLDPAMNQLEWV